METAMAGPAIAMAKEPASTMAGMPAWRPMVDMMVPMRSDAKRPWAIADSDVMIILPYGALLTVFMIFLVMMIIGGSL